MLALSGLVTLTTPTTVSAVCSAQTFLTFPVWYRGLTLDSNCSLNIAGANLQHTIFLIVLNVVEMIVQAFAYLALGYILWNALKYIRSQGQSAQISAAKDGILQASLGLFVALASVAIVRFIQGLVV
jgi:hypothetical protein